MTIERLKELLDKYGIKECFLPPEEHCYCESGVGITKDNDEYKVFIENRYKPSDISYHRTEEEAIRAFLNLYLDVSYPEFYEEAMKELNKY
ncbi:MAG: hypothetical protein LBN09_01710 [Clostridioides sp.]|jgi:hypothetical protein|nr:hypothetical protein [Clostridioides sp.]